MLLLRGSSISLEFFNSIEQSFKHDYGDKAELFAVRHFLSMKSSNKQNILLNPFVT